MKPTNTILGEYGTTIFTVMSALAVEHKAINLGQGFPDTDGPADIRAAAERATQEGPNQYPPMMGLPELRQAAAAHNKAFYDLDLDWQTQSMVTSGATEALAACLFGLVEPGDEMVMIEPLYDCYLPILRRAGGVPKLVRIEPPHWELPYDALEDAFSDNTKLIMLNTPTNPAAKVYTKEELEFIAGLMEKHDAYAVCDEVYEHMTFDGKPHIPLMTLPGMAERCIKIGSAGKTFSMTGWKVGYSVGAPKLIEAMAKAHQFLTFTTPPNLQKAVAYGLNKDNEYFRSLGIDMQAKRDRLSDGLANIGFEVMASEGTYFLTTDFRPLGFNGDDTEFCKHLTTEAGVAAVPFSPFYQAGAERGVTHFARFCFCKQNDLLDAAIERLGKHFGGV
ncbi:MAG: aminotransferase [Rhodospirillales bacterium]|nr:aminotransferase [Rhodospirillales bacterium]